MSAPDRGVLSRAKDLVRIVGQRGPIHEDDLRAALRCDQAELRAAVAIAYRWHRIDRCGSFVVFVFWQCEEKAVSTKAMAEKLSAARNYIGLGWFVFVLSSTKTPIANCQRCRTEHTTPAEMQACECLTCHGFYAGTLDPVCVEKMLRLHLNGLLAMRTGASSGTAVIDVDAPHGISTMRQLIENGVLPRTVVQRTGGGGYQLVYKHPGTGTRIMSGAGKGGVGVDIKADDAYVVVAPSVHPRTRRPYQWIGSFSGTLTPLPEYWVERLQEPERPVRTTQVPLQSVTGHRYAVGALRRQVAELLDAPEGTRNDTLNKSAFALGQLVGAGMLEEDSTAAVLEDAGQRIGLAPGEVRRSVASGLRAGAKHPRAGQL